MLDEVLREKAWKDLLKGIQPKNTRDLIKEFPGMEEIIMCLEKKRLPSISELKRFKAIIEGLI